MEFVKPFEDEIDYELVMRTIFKTRGEEWGFGGTCQLENSILYHQRLKDETIKMLKFRHLVIERETDKKHINHFILVYLQDGKVWMESRSNHIHKKTLWSTYVKYNKIVKNNDGAEFLYRVSLK